MYFVYDGKKAWITSEKVKGKGVGSVNTKEGVVSIVYQTTSIFLINKNTKKENVTQLFPLLKSNLQKQIRRGDKEAVTTANMMLDLNDFELLRRLSIIAAEDVTLSQETSVIVWLMAAVSKRYILSPKDKNFILQYVFSLTQYFHCRRLELHEKLNDNLCMKDVLESSYKDKEKLAGILFRVHFGGLSGDLPMLAELCDDFLKSGRKLESILTQQAYEICPLKICDAAIDFHIYHDLLHLIQEDIGIDEDIIKRCIWECSSRINFRFAEQTTLQNTWERIKPSFLFHTKTYLSKVIKKYL